MSESDLGFKNSEGWPCSIRLYPVNPVILSELLASHFLELLDHDWQDFHHIAHDAVRGHAEDGGVRVLVDSDDHVRRLHAGKVLNGAGDARGDVELGADG